MEDWPVYLARRREMVNRALDRYLPAEETPPTELHRSLRYSVFAGGKRLRPLLCLAAAEAVGGDPEAALPAACALEMIHTYSLIHDDLPAMDDDDFRRGRPTAHKVFGEAIAILAGDALLTEGFRILAAAAEAAEDSRSRALVRATREIAEAVSSQGMIAGQVIDIQSEGKSLALPALEAMEHLKTGRLLCAAVTVGGILGGGQLRELQALKDYGEALGLAFQIVDDLLDLTGEVRIMGKTPGSDLRKHKATFPALMGEQAAEARAAELTQKAINHLSEFGPAAESLRQFARFILSRNH